MSKKEEPLQDGKGQANTSLKIVFLDSGTFKGTTLRTPSFPHSWQDYHFSHMETASTIIERVKRADIILTNRTPITKEIMDGCEELKFIQLVATGYDIIDIEAAKARGVVVCNIRDWAVSIPEHIFALTLALRRQLFPYRRALRNDSWSRAEGTSFLLRPLPSALHGSTLGIIGHGTIAAHVITLARAFGMDIAIAERRGASTTRPDRQPFEQVLQSAEVLVILCPLNSETRGLIGAEELAAMKQDALLINCARGGIVDEHALLAALKEGKIAGAGIDVVDQEPPPPMGQEGASPLLEVELDNLIVTSHVAWASDRSVREMCERLIDNLERFVQGSPRWVVTS